MFILNHNLLIKIIYSSISSVKNIIFSPYLLNNKLKSILYNICREVNLSNLINQNIDNKHVVFPFSVSQSCLRILLKDKIEITVTDTCVFSIQL